MPASEINEEINIQMKLFIKEYLKKAVNELEELQIHSNTSPLTFEKCILNTIESVRNYQPMQFCLHEIFTILKIVLNPLDVEKDIFEEIQQNGDTYQELIMKLANQKDIDITFEEKYKLNREIMDFDIQAGIEKRYREKLMESSIDQKRIFLKGIEQSLENEIKTLETKALCESFTFQAIQVCNQNILKNFERKLNILSEKYRQDLGELETEIKTTQGDLQQVNKDYEIKTELFRQRQQCMDDFYHKRRENRSAKIIQAWWRAILSTKRSKKKKMKAKKGRKPSPNKTESRKQKKNF